jgi:hypothetical protein
MQETVQDLSGMEVEGQVNVMTGVGGVIFLIVGFAVATLISIFTGVLSGQTWQLSESKIDSITNTTIKEKIKAGAISSFDASKQIQDFLPIVGLAFMVVIILGLVLGLLAMFTMGMGRGYGGGGAL